MIVGFRHKGLKLLFEKGDRRKVPPEHAAKIGRILARLEEASEARHMDLPGFRLHRLKGGLAGYWAVTVSGNLPSPKRSPGYAQAGLRIVFRFEGGQAGEVDLIDYH